MTTATAFWRRAAVRRTTEITLTGLFWLAWLYLIAPLLSALLWLAGVELFTEEMLVKGGYRAVLGNLRDYGLVVLGMAAAILAWVEWNLRRYGHRNLRRRQPAAVGVDELATLVRSTSGSVLAMQDATRIVVDFDSDDRLEIRRLR